MLLLSIRTDKPEAEVGLYENELQLVYRVWPAHRQLAETLHSTVQAMLVQQQCTLSAIQGIAVYKGPGSFTGLRIGITVANTLAYSLGIPIVGAEDPQWLQISIKRLLAGANDQMVVPEYGALPLITQQKK